MATTPTDFAQHLAARFCREWTPGTHAKVTQDGPKTQVECGGLITINLTVHAKGADLDVHTLLTEVDPLDKNSSPARPAEPEC